MPKRYKRNCNTCGKYYHNQGRMYCSKKCTPTPKKFLFSKRFGGKKHTKETLLKKRLVQLEEKGSNWQGGSHDYRSLHSWVQDRLGSPEKCAKCGKDGLKKQKIHWANISHEYKRDLKDWIRLCSSCHRLYDYGKIKL